jgi:hypothetical protein
MNECNCLQAHSLTLPGSYSRLLLNQTHDWKEGLATGCWTETSEFCVDVVSQPGQSPLDITVPDPSDIGALLNLTGTLTVGLDDGVGTCPS